MQIKLPQLNAHLHKSLAPVYLVNGDEPQQTGEAADLIRQAAKAQSYESREIFFVDKLYDWQALNFSADNFSIFSDKKILDLRLTGMPGTEGAKALTAYCQHVSEDTLLLITTGKLGKDAQKSAWFQAIDKVGCIIQVWSLTGQDLLTWIQNRLQRRGLTAEPEAVKLLADRVEGNLLAAAQEIEKLHGFYGASRLTSQNILDVVADSSRYDVFEWVECILASKVNKIIKILDSLKAENIAPAIILWALTRETRLLSKTKIALNRGENKDSLLRNNAVWGNHKILFELALKRLTQTDLNHALTLNAKADRQIKGQEQGNPWETLLKIALTLASVKVMDEAAQIN